MTEIRENAKKRSMIFLFCRSFHEAIECRSVVTVHCCKMFPNRLHVLRIGPDQLNHVTLIPRATCGKFQLD